MMSEENIFFCPSGTPSSKNSRQWTGKRFLPSRATIAWRAETQSFWEDNKDRFIEQLKDVEKPYKLGFHFVRKSKHQYDWVNPIQTMQDEMSKYGWIDDDNTLEMIPYPLCIDGQWSSYSKENPGCYMKIIKDPEEIKQLHEILNIQGDGRDN